MLESINPGKVLIVDDDINLCKMLQDMLEEYDFKTVYAETAEAALIEMRNFKPYTALVDFKLGSVSGLELAKSMKDIDPDLPVILITAYPTMDLAVKAIKNDVYDFLPKPVESANLLRSITKAVEKRNLIEENKRLIISLKKSNAELDRLNHLKSKFLSIVTHDLRTPLTSIRGYADVLRTPELLTPDIQKKCHSVIENSIERMSNLIGNLMDIVSIEAGKLRVEKVPLDYKAVCRELEDTFAPVAKSREIILTWDITDKPLMAPGDPNRLVQVLTNLISNAFKHTPPKGKVQVKVTIQEKNSPPAILTEVIDNGAGIAPENQQKIFEQFFQVETSPTRRDGLGLGLVISKDIVAAHGGVIGVESEGLGKGSRFYFTLPMLDENKNQNEK